MQDDSRLDRYPKMVKGEAKIVWEWQGMTSVKVWQAFPINQLMSLFILVNLLLNHCYCLFIV